MPCDGHRCCQRTDSGEALEPTACYWDTARKQPGRATGCPGPGFRLPVLGPVLPLPSSVTSSERER